MAGYEDFKREPRFPTDSELLNFELDAKMMENGALPDVIDSLAIKLAEANDIEAIKNLIIAERRLSFLRGIVAQSMNPDLLDEIMKNTS